MFSTLKNEENGLPKNCYTTNRKHCATVQGWGVVEPQSILRGWASSVDPSRVNISCTPFWGGFAIADLEYEVKIIKFTMAGKMNLNLNFILNFGIT